MVAPTVDALAERLDTILDNGAALGRPRFDPAENLRTWSAWHRSLAADRARRTPAGSSGNAVERSGEAVPAILILTMDAGGTSLARLLDHAGTHLERFGT